MNYVITRKDTFEVDNKVYFADDHGDTLALRDELMADGHNWVIAKLEVVSDVAGNRQ